MEGRRVSFPSKVCQYRLYDDDGRFTGICGIQIPFGKLFCADHEELLNGHDHAVRVQDYGAMVG
jgi:hypothetical protein